MKLSISNIAWAPEDDKGMYEYLQRLDFKGLEIAPTRLFSDKPYDNLTAAKAFSVELKEQYGLEVSSLQSICFGRNEPIFGSGEDRETLMNYIRQAIDFAAAINCKNLVFGSPKNRVINDGQEHIALSFFDGLGHYAHQHNTIMAIEPNPEIYGTNFLNKTGEAVDFVKNVNNPGLMVNLDVGTIIENDEDPGMISDYLGYINHIHISEPFLEPVQERALHKELSVILKRSSYNGYISIEMKNPNDLKVVKDVMKYIKVIFNGN